MYSEGVKIGIVGWLVGVRHEVDSIARRAYEKDLEYRVIGTVGKGPEEIDVSCDVNYQVESLRFEGYAGTGLLTFIIFHPRPT